MSRPGGFWRATGPEWRMETLFLMSEKESTLATKCINRAAREEAKETRGKRSPFCKSRFYYLSSYQEAQTTVPVALPMTIKAGKMAYQLRLLTPAILMYCKLTLKSIITQIENVFYARENYLSGYVSIFTFHRKFLHHAMKWLRNNTKDDCEL